MYSTCQLFFALLYVYQSQLFAPAGACKGKRTVQLCARKKEFLNTRKCSGLAAKQKKMVRVCVIGAGPAGMGVLYQVNETGLIKRTSEHSHSKQKYIFLDQGVPEVPPGQGAGPGVLREAGRDGRQLELRVADGGGRARGDRPQQPVPAPLDQRAQGDVARVPGLHPRRALGAAGALLPAGGGRQGLLQRYKTPTYVTQMITIFILIKVAGTRTTWTMATSITTLWLDRSGLTNRTRRLKWL